MMYHHLLRLHESALQAHYHRVTERENDAR